LERVLKIKAFVIFSLFCFPQVSSSNFVIQQNDVLDIHPVNLIIADTQKSFQVHKEVYLILLSPDENLALIETLLKSQAFLIPFLNGDTFSIQPDDYLKVLSFCSQWLFSTNKRLLK
jgi:hypothetical protein